MRAGFQQDFPVAACKGACLQIDIGISQRLGDFNQRDAMRVQFGRVGINGYLPLFTADDPAFTDIADASQGNNQLIGDTPKAMES